MKEQLYWGKLTWWLFHTIAEKMNDIKELSNITNLIILICHNLPCPYCKDHAKIYLNKKPINKMVKTKEELKKYIYDFHNVVNLRTKKNIYPPEILNQYTSVNLGVLLNNWIRFFKIYRITPYVMKEHIEREKIKKKVSEYLILNQNKFTN